MLNSFDSDNRAERRRDWINKCKTRKGFTMQDPYSILRDEVVVSELEEIKSDLDDQKENNDE